jgi:hypothetical protein
VPAAPAARRTGLGISAAGPAVPLARLTSHSR